VVEIVRWYNILDNYIEEEFSKNPHDTGIQLRDHSVGSIDMRPTAKGKKHK
jgi:hypothetical protein